MFKQQSKIINNQSFTLIELMVSLSILAMVILSAMGIYLKVIGTRQKTLGQLNIQEEGQYLMSLIVKDIRAGMVDYSSYGGTLTSPEDELFLLDFSYPQNQIRYKTDLNASGDCAQDRCVLQRCQAVSCSAGDYKNITQTNVSIERLDFYISPTDNPFTAGSTDYTHPRVTIVLKFKSLVEKIGVHELVIQQTVPQRYTQRK
ncbi:prepilin-type N-terminal cleavage/methylation domain-containing protein [Patescibacteria group bacterium]|nr:prepilin-type N-terminal cleavage/methylation domain-containing protein [Patescibacteria group bacterium]